MSTGQQVALLPPLGRGEAAPRLRGETRTERPLVVLASFAALGAYGVLRWSALEHGAPTGRLLALLALALGLAAAGPLLRRRGALAAAVLCAIALVAMFPLAGVPLPWITHVRIAVTASVIGEGLFALPSILVPYAGLDVWVRLAIALGAAVLLLDAGIMVALAPRGGRGVWRAAAALPLLALAVIPSTIVHPQLPYLQGLILFALLAAFVWGDQIESDRVAGAVALLVLAAVLALILAPALERHRPWLDYQALAGRLVKTESFDWSQGYGPIDWPRTGRAVLEVKAARPEYWKAENLDVFEGRGWLVGSLPGAGDPAGTISRAVRRRWSQTIEVTLRSILTTQVIAAGAAGTPVHLARAALAGPSPGTWIAAGQLGPGDSYRIKTYTPEPSESQLATAGTDYPATLLPGYLTIYLPIAGQLQGQLEQVLFAPFGSSRAAAYGPASQDPGPLLRASPYARAYALALRLRHGATTPFAYARAVERYLSRGFSYDENPAPAAYPLERFLFVTRAGYCQQFAGAMAMLLRMGGVPARVAVGFTAGSYDAATRRWVVSDLDAHAWVEAWFPHYGWVRFDPTPGAAPEFAGHSPIAGSSASAGTPAAKALRAHGHGTVTPGGSRPLRGGGTTPLTAGTAAPWIVLALLGAVLAAGILATRPLASSRAELAELERAFVRAGRPLAADVTLLALERRLAASPAAAEYVRAIRRARFGAAVAMPSATGRRALRSQLRAGLGPLGPVRALWALPPRRTRRARRAAA